MQTVLFHPIFTFCTGLILALAMMLLLLSSCASPNRSEQELASYRKALDGVAPSGLVAGSPGEEAALERFKGFLKGIGDKKFIQENTLKAYAADAYLDDTLVVHHGAAEIQAYFIKTSETMTSFQVTIDDVARSGEDYYVRWTMIFSAPALSSGTPVHSVGISQVRFNRDGKVEFHRDFWDSGKNFYAHLPVVGGAVGFVRKRLEAN